jgi:predicted O-linked N-acetylglucosamine transferase (SPINDLY family)
MSAAEALKALGAAPTIEDGRAALARGDVAEAIDLLHAVTEARPADHESRYWLYSALVAGGHSGLAGPILADARNLHAVSVIRSVGGDMERFRTDPAYCGALGLQLYEAKLMGPATLALGKGLDFDNLDPALLVSYGLSMQHQGRMAEAIDVFTAAAEMFPTPQIHAFLIYPLFHAPDRLKRVSEEARKWAALHAAPHTPKVPVFAGERTASRRLRIGYVGPSFTRNQVAQFLTPVLEAHDPEAVEVFLYCTDPAGEAGLPDHCKVRAIGALSDAEVVKRIRADKIDILIDVWGHTAGSRLGVFGHRPAPVQVAWINFVQTTGLETMDYVLHADSMAVEGTAQYFTETVWPIGPVVTPCRLSPHRQPAGPTPALKAGHVTFGSFNNPAKISETTVEAWSRILCARPDDRLVLKYAYYIDPVLQRVTRARFAAYGVDPDQLEFRGHSTGVDYWREFADIDLALDPSPCPGGTTSCDALASGVPVLTQWGDDFFSRIGVPVVLPCGLPELIADDWDDYVQRALDLTADPEALDALRRKTRAGFEASPYRDEVGFTRNLEDVFRQMYGRWLENSR